MEYGSLMNTFRTKKTKPSSFSNYILPTEWSVDKNISNM